DTLFKDPTVCMGFLVLVSVGAGPKSVTVVLRNGPISGSRPGFGLGFHLGVPSGFAFSHKQKRSLKQATIGWNLGKSSLRVTADQVWTFYQHEPEPKLHFPVSFGIGGFVYLNEENKDALIGDTYRDIYGLRFPLVLAVNHDEVAIDGYFELVPRFSIFPSTEMDLIGGVGCRAYFF
ncbi:MAG: hypothetical protein VX026_01245, partial [Myxococcota bacterium]|nr:hypothetical protein [Myxococcota bacterium]